jgi:hypothetical protein
MLNTMRDQKRLDIASARQWLAEGAPISDVLTVLEVRHSFELASADGRTYAVEILRAAQQLVQTPKPTLNSHRKEAHHALA